MGINRVFKEKLNASRPSEHPPVRGKSAKTFRWDHRLQIQNLFMAFKRIPDSSIILGQQYNTGEKPTVMLYTYVILIAIIQGHQIKTKTKHFEYITK